MRAVYQTADYGEHRAVRLLDDSGHDLAPPRDPFWPAGAPASPKARQNRINRVAQEMLAEYRRRKP